MNDLISRQAAIEALNIPDYENGEAYLQYESDVNAIRSLPAQPERKKGKWLKAYWDHEAFGVRPFSRYCSECNETTVYAYDFCPNCGAEMKGDSDD